MWTNVRSCILTKKALWQQSSKMLNFQLCLRFNTQYLEIGIAKICFVCFLQCPKAHWHLCFPALFCYVYTESTALPSGFFSPYPVSQPPPPTRPPVRAIQDNFLCSISTPRAHLAPLALGTRPSPSPRTRCMGCPRSDRWEFPFPTRQKQLLPPNALCHVFLMVRSP